MRHAATPPPGVRRRQPPALTVQDMKKLRSLSRSLLFLASALLLAGILWQAIAWTVSGVRGVEFPTPLMTVRHLGGLLGGAELIDHSIYRHVADSVTRWFFGFVLAGSAGLVAGVLLGRCPVFCSLTLPLVHGLQLIPGLAWIPVALLLFGICEQTTVFMIAITAFPPIAINVLAGVKEVDATYLRAARMLGARGFTLVVRVLLPGALPHILSGLRVGLGNGWRVLLAAEMVVGSGTGLGYSIIQARWTLDYTSAFACLSIILLIGLLIERVVFASVERWTMERWRLLDSGGRI